MTDRGSSRTDTGAVLVFALLLMLALVGLGHGLLVSALAELAASRAGARHLQARAAADAAVARTLRVSSGPWMDSIRVGEAHHWYALSLGRASSSATLSRLTSEAWLVEGRGIGPAAGETRTAALAWALDPQERILNLPAAVSGRAGARWHLEGEIDASDPTGDGPPWDAADCAPWLGELQAHYAASPLAAHGIAADTLGGPGLGLVAFGSLMAAAEVRVVGAGTPGPVESFGACAVDEAWSWGGRDHPGPPCGSHLPLRSAQGDLVVQGGVGQGVLVVDGDLTFTSGARYHGLVLVRGVLRLDGAATLQGMAIALEGAHVGAGSRIGASACWALRALDAQRAALGGLRAVPGVGPLGPL
jgi:hypothetical protein